MYIKKNYKNFNNIGNIQIQFIFTYYNKMNEIKINEISDNGYYFK